MLINSNFSFKSRTNMITSKVASKGTKLDAKVKGTPSPKRPSESVSLSRPIAPPAQAPRTSEAPAAQVAVTKRSASELIKSDPKEPMAILDFPTSTAPAEHSSNIDGFLTKFLPSKSQVKTTTDVGNVTKNQFDFDKGTEVVSSAQKFIIPVPTFSGHGGGEDLVYPKGAKNSDGENIDGQPIADWRGNPIGQPGEKGVVFFNHKDQSYQAVKADGSGVVILNQVTDEQGKKLQDKIGADPSKLSLAEFKGALEYAHRDLGVGDQYNSDRGFISSKMNAMETSETGVAQYGLHRRDDRDVCHAIHVEGSGSFQGPAATPQKFENGAVLLRQPNS